MLHHPFPVRRPLGALIKKHQRFIAKSDDSVLFQPYTECMRRLRAIGYLEPVWVIAQVPKHSWQQERKRERKRKQRPRQNLWEDNDVDNKVLLKADTIKPHTNVSKVISKCLKVSQRERIIHDIVYNYIILYVCQR